MASPVAEEKTIHDVVRSHDIAAVSSLLDAGADINAIDEESATPLYYAFLANDMPMFEFLLSKKPDLEIVFPDEGRLLDIAVGGQKLDYVRRLVQAGADIDHLVNGYPHLHSAIYQLRDSRHESLTDYLTELIRALMRPGMDLTVKDANKKRAFDLLMETKEFDLARELVHLAAQPAAHYPLLKFFHNTSNRKYIFSQRGSTCGPDAFFTFCFFSDATRPYFRALAADPDRVADVEAVDKLGEGIAAAARRFVSFKKLQHNAEATNAAGPLRKRRPSIGPLCDAMGMKEGITGESAGENTGIDVEDIERSSRAIFTENKYGIFPTPAMLRPVKFDYFEETLVPVPKDLDLTQIEGMYIGLTHEITDYNLLMAKRGSVLPSGHAISFFKYKGQWVLSDNESEFLHIFKDQSFITDHFLPALRNDSQAVKISFLPVFHSIGIQIQTPTAVYPPTGITLKYGTWKYTLGSGVIFMRGDAPTAAAAAAATGTGAGAAATGSGASTQGGRRKRTLRRQNNRRPSKRSRRRRA